MAIVLLVARTLGAVFGTQAMIRRIAYGTVALTVLLALFVADIAVANRSQGLDGPLRDLLTRGSVIPVVLLVVIVLAAVEFDRLARAKQVRPHTRFAYLMIAILFLTPWLSAAGWMGHGAAQMEGIYWQVVWLIVAVVGVGALTVARRAPEGAIRDAGVTLAMILSLGFMASFALQLRCGTDTPEQQGAWLLLIVLLVTKVSDIGAYFAGSIAGRHKLIPEISPAKSIEGTVGGLLASAVLAVLFVFANSVSADAISDAASESGRALLSIAADATRAFGAEVSRGTMSPTVRALLFGLALSAVGQLGDLVESCFKRDAGVKDSGTLVFPLGGILDLIDSPVLAVPVAWFLLTAVWNIV